MMLNNIYALITVLSSILLAYLILIRDQVYFPKQNDFLLAGLLEVSLSSNTINNESCNQDLTDASSKDLSASPRVTNSSSE